MSKYSPQEILRGLIVLCYAMKENTVLLHVKSSEWHQLVPSNRCNDPECLACIQIDLANTEGLRVPGQLDIDSLEGYEMPSDDHIDRAYAFLQKRAIREASDAVKTIIFESAHNDYVPQVGDAVVFHNESPADLGELAGFVCAVLTEEQAKAHAKWTGNWATADILIVGIMSGKHTIGASSSSRVRKVGHCSEYGIAIRDLMFLAERERPLGDSGFLPAPPRLK